MCTCSCHTEDERCEQCCDGPEVYFGGKSLSEAAKRFRKKPVTVEAIQFNYNYTEIATFLSGSKFSYNTLKHRVFIETLEGTMEATPSDWIIKGVKGEFYPCKPDIFEASYEAV